MSQAALAYGGATDAALASCWQIADGKLTVYVQDDPAAIKHSLVRTFGYLYTEYYAERLGRLQNDLELADKVRDGAARLKQQRVNMAAALLADTKGAPPAVRARLTTYAKQAPADFSNYAIAEAVDSYYCSSASRETLRKAFPATYKAFTKGDFALTSDLGEAAN
jgi:hypothetical protein